MSRSLVRVALLFSALVVPFAVGCSAPPGDDADDAEHVATTSQALCSDPHAPSWTLDLPAVNQIFAVSQGAPAGGTYGNSCSNYFVTEIDGTVQRTFGLEIQLPTSASVSGTNCSQSYVVSYVEGYRPASYSFFLKKFYPAAWDRLRDVSLTHATWTGTRCVIRQAFNVDAGVHTQVNVSAGVWGPTGALPVEVVAHGGPISTAGY